MPRVYELLESARKLPGSEGPREGEVLLCAALDKPRSYLYAWPDADVDPASVEKFSALLTERARGTPVAYLLGRREFWGLDLRVSEATLIPRADTECLVETALELELPETDARVLDLGTGSGAIALALAKERSRWSVTGTDLSAEALGVAEENARRNGLSNTRWLLGSWFDDLNDERFDLIVSNPPYLAESDPHLQEGDLRFEPLQALVAGEAGLGDLMAIIRGAARHLVKQGWLVLEHGMAQGEAVRSLLIDAGFVGVSTRRDIAGHERVTSGCQKAAGS